jgi:phosphate starvation-inducible protein PhoH
MFYGLQLSDEQYIYADSISDNRLTIADCKAGSGKTVVAVGMAKIIGKPLLYIIAPVQEKTMGFLPGDKHDKESVYFQPLKDALIKIGDNPDKSIKNPKEFNVHAWVEAPSHVHMRGSTIENHTVIVDEVQKFTTPELRKVLTRLADSCTVIMIGHAKQCDLQNPSLSGFVPYKNYFSKKWYCKVVNLTKNFRGELAQDADDF